MRFKPPEPNVAEIDMTPLIDIVFQLIAFFMVVTNFEQTQADERVILPKDQLAVPPATARENELVINIGFDRYPPKHPRAGEKEDPEPWVYYNDQKIRVEDFEPQLVSECQIFQDQQKDINNITLVIRADAEVPMGKVQKIIELAQKKTVGFVKFAIKARQETPD